MPTPISCCTCAMRLDRTMPEYKCAAKHQQGQGNAGREAARARSEDGANRQRDEDDRGATIADQVKPPEHLTEDRPREQPCVRHLAERDDVENCRRRDRAEDEQSANPDGNRQDCGEPKHKHSSHYN